MRRFLSFLMATALLLAGLALAGFEITHADALRPFVLIGALVIIAAGGALAARRVCVAALATLTGCWSASPAGCSARSQLTPLLILQGYSGA